MVIQLHSKDQNILPQSTKERWYGRIAAFLGTFVELKAIISSIFRKIGREVYCTCLENKRTCECSRGSNPLSSAIKHLNNNYYDSATSTTDVNFVFRF